ncbi:MAG: DUF6502 family protein [Gammaproteobacteria bacterium]
MNTKPERVLASSVRRLLRPLVRILVRNGYAYGALAEQIRRVYVEVAYDEFPPEGKKQTVSRVSGLTGLTRKEVKRLLESNDAVGEGGQDRYNRAVRVVSGWVGDKRFHDTSGKPAVLPVEGKRKSFTLLVKEYSGDIPTMAMLDMLVDAGSVRKLDGKVRLVRHAYIPGGDSIDKIRILGSDVAELIDTIDHNLTAADAELLFQRKVAYDNIDPLAVAKLRKVSFKKAQLLLEQLNTEFAKHDLAEESDVKGKYVSLGIYYHEHDSGEE